MFEDLKVLFKEAVQGTSIVFKFYGTVLLVTYVTYKFYYHII